MTHTCVHVHVDYVPRNSIGCAAYIRGIPRMGTTVHNGLLCLELHLARFCCLPCFTLSSSPLPPPPPPPFPPQAPASECPVYIKIADMGISRRMTPGGVMGFKGSPGFMAPEILKYVGTEACTEKVRIGSYCPPAQPAWPAGATASRHLCVMYMCSASLYIHFCLTMFIMSFSHHICCTIVQHVHVHV